MNELPKVGTISALYVCMGYVAAAKGIHENPFINHQLPERVSAIHWQRGHDDYMASRAGKAVQP